LGLEPGPVVGQALQFLLELRRAEGSLGEAEVLARLDSWWGERSR
jgi:poly(A) polymerase